MRDDKGIVRLGTEHWYPSMKDSSSGVLAGGSGNDPQTSSMAAGTFDSMESVR